MARLSSRQRDPGRPLGRTGVQWLETGTPEGPEPLEIDNADRHPGRVLPGEVEDLLGRARGDAGRGDDGERNRVAAGAAGGLEHGLGEERHETVGPAFAPGLHLDDVDEPAPPDPQLGPGPASARRAADLPAGLHEGASQPACHLSLAGEDAGAPRIPGSVHGSFYHGHANSHGHDNTSARIPARPISRGFGPPDVVIGSDEQRVRPRRTGGLICGRIPAARDGPAPEGSQPT